MLQIFKNIHLLRSQAPKQISNQFLRNFAKSSSRKTHEALHERERMRFTKKEANVQIVEQLYFPDHSTLKINEFIQEKREQQTANNPNAQTLGKVELNPEDMKYIESLSSQGVNEEVNSKSFFFPESREEMSKLIAHTDINDKLLKFYMKHHRQCGKQQIFELLAKLEENFKKEDEVRIKELEKHKAKTRKLQEINPDIEVRFNAVFLTREETLKHNGFKFLLRNINFKAEKEIYQPYTVFELYHSLLKFDPLAYEQIEPVFLKMFEKSIDSHDLFTIAKFINFLQHHAEVQMPFKQANHLMRLATDALNKKDFSKITKKEILAIIIPLKKIGIIPDATLMFRLEPYILKYLKQFEPNQLAEIYTTYLRFRRGSSAFMDFMINALLLNLRRMNLSYVKTIMTMSFPKLTYRSDLPYPELRRRAAAELMKKLKTWSLTNTDLLEVTRAFVVAGIGEQNYYEMLSVEFMKKITQLEPAVFVEIYNLLALSGIKSEALVYGCNRRLEEFLNEMQETFRAEIKGLLDAGEDGKEEVENDVLPKDVKLNIYEKKFVQEFTQLVKALWSYSFFIVKSKKFELVDIDMWNRGVKELNDMIKKIKGFGGLVPFSRMKMEMLYQMNHFSRIHGKHSLSVNIQGLNDANLMFSDVKDPLPLSHEVRLFLIEKKYFMEKYSSVIARFPQNKDYQYKFDLKNKEKNTAAHIFVNSAVDFLDSFSAKEIRPKGYLEARRHFLGLIDAQYIEIGFDKFLKDIYNVRKMKGGYFEEYLKKYVELPVLDGNESEEASKLWEKIKKLRENIPETSLAALEQEFTMELQEKKLGDYLKDFEQGKAQAAAEEVESDDVYIDSEDEAGDAAVTVTEAGK